MGDIPQVDVNHFNSCGYVIVRGVFSKAEIANLRQRVQDVKARAVTRNGYLTDPKHKELVLILGDLLSNRELADLDYVIFDQRVVSCVKQILGPDLVYFGDSSVQTGEGERGFHKDNVDRYDVNGADWQSDYTLVRVGLYLQDHSRLSGGLKLRVRSHCYPSYHQGKAIDVKSDAGDVVLWSLRTTHSGNNVRLKGLTSLCLHPRLEAMVPDYLKASGSDERIAMFGTFGAPSAHLDRYIENMVRRGDYDAYLKRAGLNKEILALADKRGIQIRKPIKEYGQLYPFREEC
jgi:hypothetical protein